MPRCCLGFLSLSLEVLIICYSMTHSEVGNNATIFDWSGYCGLRDSRPDGESGVETAIAVQPDLILLDVILPGYNGFQVCRTIKSIPDLNAVPIVMITSKGDERDKSWGLAQGAEDYIFKPFNPAELIALVDRILAKEVNS